MSKKASNDKLHPNPDYQHATESRMTSEEAKAAWDVEATGMADNRQIRLHLPLYGAQSFEELETVSAEELEQKRIGRLKIYFMLILGNIVNNPDIDIEEVGLRLHAAVAEYGNKLDGLHDDIAPANTDDDTNLIPKEMKRKAPIKREGGIDRPARDYAYVPNPSAPATWRLPMTDAPGVVSLRRLNEAAAALSPGGLHGIKVNIPASALSAVKRRILSEYRTLKVPEGKIPMNVKESKPGGQFAIWKEKSTGRYRWMAVYSNNFIDRDDPPEIISAKSHETFVQLVDEGVVDYPELWHWHVPGTAWGKADMLDYVDGFALAVGYIYPGHEKEAAVLAGRKDLGVSHGMPFATLLYNPANPGVIDFHVTREISVLPHHAVANPLTDFVILDNSGGTNMPITKAKRDWLINDLGLDEEVVSNLERNLKDMSALADAIGLASKEAEEDELEEDELEEEEYEEEDVDYDDDDSEEKSLRRPRDRDDTDQEEKGRPQSGSSGSKRGKGYLWTGKKRTKPSSFAGKRDKPSSFAADDDKPSSFAGGRKKPSSFAMRRGKKKEAEGETEALESAEYVTREEVAEAFAEMLNPIMETINEFGNVLKEIGTVVKEMSENDAERLGRVKEQTPTLSLSSLIRDHIAIGQDAAKVDGRTQLAKEGPVEAEAETPMYTPSSFVNGLMSTAMSGSSKQARE